MSGANQVDTSKLKDIGIISFIEKPIDQRSFNETLKELTRGIKLFN